MVDLTPATLELWRSQLLAICQSLACVLANLRGVSPTSAWTYARWVWEGPLTARHSYEWAKNLELLARAVAAGHRLGLIHALHLSP